MLCSQCRRAILGFTRLRVVQRSRRWIASTSSSSSIQSRLISSVSVTNSQATRYVSSLRYSTIPNAAIDSTSASTSSTITSSKPEKPDYLNEAETAIWDKLSAEFFPTELMVQDVSGGCGSMYGIEITSEKFRGTNMLKQQRMVNAVLGEEMKKWHGVQLRTKIP